jgi:capsular polysaccharide biosynthesis protein
MHYHFLFDLLPRLWVRERSEVGVRKIAVPNTITQEQVEILRTHYGIPADELVLWSADGAACCFEHAVVVPTFVSDMWAMPETILSPRKALRFAAPPKDSAYRNVKRLYVSRRDVQDGRPLLNEDEVVTRLTAMGFTEIFPGRFSYAEEMHLFQNAEIIVGPFGSGMANIMFCQPGSRIVILQPDSTNWRILSFVMGFLGLEYGYVFGESFRRRARAHNTEWLIDVDDVCRRVASLL